MLKVALKVLFGFGMCGALVYLVFYSNILDLLEGTNLDGSVSITWRSETALICLIAICGWISFWAFRRTVALNIFLGLAACIISAYLLFESKLGFIWEPHQSDGTFPLTWRSDLVIISLLLVTQGASILIVRMVRRYRERIREKRIATHPNI